ncbi:hypothetical protein OROGR_019333 [Orobanche gracilis]
MNAKVTNNFVTISVQMEDEYNNTMALEDTVALESPMAESPLINLDINTEILDVCESDPQHSGEHMEDNYCQKEVVLDSDDEGGGQNEAIDLVNGCIPRIGRLCSRGEIGLRKRQRVRAGCFRRLDIKVRKHVFRHTDSATSDRCDEESNTETTCLYGDSRFREHLGVMDSVLSTSPGCLPDDSLDERRLSSHGSKSTNMGKYVNYDESPEAAESHAKALGFVDHYLSVSDLGSYKNIETGKTNRITSPPSLRSKGSQYLASRVSLARNASNLMTFDWTEKYIGKDEYATLRMNEDSVFGFEGERSEQLSSIQESGNVELQNKISGLHSKEKSPGNISSTNGVDTNSFNSNNTDKIGSSSGICTVYESVEFGKGFDAGLSSQKMKEGENLEHTPETLDIGLDTQIAAEAMEALIHAPPPMFDPCLTRQVSDIILLDSSNPVNKKAARKNVDYEEAFVGWRCKERRSRCMNIYSVQEKRDSLKEFQRIHCLYDRKSKETTDGLQSDSPQKRRKMTRSDDDVCKIGIRDSSFKEKTDTLRRDENINLDVADRPLSKLNPWNYPKGKRSRPCTVGHSNRSSNQCYPRAVIENNVEKYPILNEETQKRVPNVFLVYKRRRKVSLEREHIRSSLELAGDSSPSVNHNVPSEEKLQVQIPVEFGTANPSRQCYKLDDVKISSFDAPNIIKSDMLLSSGHSSTLSKQPSDHFSRSMKELTRLGYTESLPDFLPKDSRRRRATEKVCILFSQNLEPSVLKQQRKIAARFGFLVTSCCSEATHFVTDRFVRTRNMLEAIALGKHVVTHFWLESCEQAGYIIDEKSYILRDEKKEKEIGFNLPASLSRASQHPLLKGRKVLITPNVKPDVNAIISLVKAVGGQVVPSIQNANTKDKVMPELLILSCEEDYTICLPFIEKGASFYSSELLLNGIVTQKLEFERHKVFKDSAKIGPSCVSRRRNGK